MIGDPRRLTEAQWAAIVDDVALMAGWRVFGVVNSTREIVRKSGARVRVRNVNASGVGFPDRVMVRARDRRLIFVEYKRERDATHHSPGLELAQEAWIRDLRAVADRTNDDADTQIRMGGSAGWPQPLGVYVWKPSDFDHVQEVLK